MLLAGDPRRVYLVRGVRVRVEIARREYDVTRANDTPRHATPRAPRHDTPRARRSHHAARAHSTPHILI